MNNRLAETSYLPKPKKRACIAAAICGSLLVMVGCHIPEPRCALPGPAVPQSYRLNNGAMFWSHGADYSTDYSTETDVRPRDAIDDATGPDLEAEPTESAATRLKNFFNPIRLASHVKPASGVETDDIDSPHKIDNTLDDEPIDNSTDAGAIDAPFAPPYLPGSDMDVVGNNMENSAHLPMGVFFNDPYLLNLINESLSGNQELRILAEEINIANNETYARSGEYLPFVSLGAGAGVEKSSRFSRDGAVEDQLSAAPGRGFPEPLPDFLVATNVSWELDIWRKLRNAQDAAAMRYLGSQEGRNYIVTRLVAEVSENYYELLALDNRRMTLEKTIEIQEQSLKVAKSMKEAGRATELAVQRFQAEVHKNQSERLIIQQEIVQTENRINFLAGRYPQPVERMSVEYIDLNLNALSAGLPSELLYNRADIRQAEREVAAAGLDVEVARARFYPSLGLRAGIGLNAYNMRYLLSTPESLIYNAALDMVGPLINKRAIEADYSSANAAQLQSIYNYQRTVLTAHIEVVNYMTKAENYRQSIEVKRQQLEALEASVDAGSKLFQNARAEYLEVLLAQREMMEARMVLIETKQQQLGAIVNAYQALGGGGF